MYAFYGLLILTRGTLPRLRIDQLLAFAWKFLLPLGAGQRADRGARGA